MYIRVICKRIFFGNRFSFFLFCKWCVYRFKVRVFGVFRDEGRSSFVSYLVFFYLVQGLQWYFGGYDGILGFQEFLWVRFNFLKGLWGQSRKGQWYFWVDLFVSFFRFYFLIRVYFEFQFVQLLLYVDFDLFFLLVLGGWQGTVVILGID